MGNNRSVSLPGQKISPLDEKREAFFREKEDKVIKEVIEEFEGGQEGLDPEHQDIDDTDSVATIAELALYKYPFENLIFEGGGNKGLAYCGAIRCLEELGLMSQIKRVGGASAGAITAALVALGFNSTEIEKFMSQDLEHIFLDHSYGYLSLLPNIINGWGWNPGRRCLDWLGETFKEKTGFADLTFYQLYKLRGIELCVVVTNLNLMKSEFCHPKTTPNMPIRNAVRMSMSIPVVFMACTQETYSDKDVYVDGGVLCNYPIQCFDGWYLSMDKKDAFLLHMQQLDDLCQMFSVRSRFQNSDDVQNALNWKSLGFLLFDSFEADVMREYLEKRDGVPIPEKPTKDTKLYIKKLTATVIQNKLRRKREKLQNSVEAFFKALHYHNLEDEVHIDKEELRKAFEDETHFPVKDRDRLFGKDVTVDEAFDYLDTDKNGKIDIIELMRFLETRNIHIQNRIQGYRRTNIGSFFQFCTALQDSWVTNLKYLYVGKDDYKRTVGINTGHVGTSNYDTEKEDKEFVVARGYNATIAYLRYFIRDHSDKVVRKDAAVNGNSSPVS